MPGAGVNQLGRRQQPVLTAGLAGSQVARRAAVSKAVAAAAWSAAASGVISAGFGGAIGGGVVCGCGFTSAALLLLGRAAARPS